MIWKPNNSKTNKVIAHMLIWAFLVAFPFLLTNSESFDLIRMVKFTWMPMFFYLITFYTNHFILVDRFLFTKKFLPFILINLILIAGSTWAIFEIKEFLNMFAPQHTKPLPGSPLPPPKTFYVYKDTLSMIIPVIIAIAIKAIEKWNKNEIEKKEKESESLNNELQNLKYQLQPHFFFNSLNTVYGLIEQSPQQAQETVHKLSKLMRYLLYDAESEKVRLSDEISFLQQYIELMKLRTNQKVIIATNFEDFNSDKLITPLLFISLIENAFKHGVSAAAGSELKFHISETKSEIIFTATNTNFPKTTTDKSGSGIGIINLQKRLSLTYPGKHSFSFGTENNLYITTLKVQTS